MKTPAKKNKHDGGSFDDFLKTEGIYEEVCIGGAKKLIAAQLAEALEQNHKTVSAMAKEMKTSRSAIYRLLDENNHSFSIGTLSKAAALLGRKVKIELVEA